MATEGATASADGGRSSARARLLDAGLAAVALAATVATAALVGATGRPTALAGGVAAALVLEAALQQRRGPVRRLWDHPATKLVASVAFVGALVLVAAVAPSAGLSLLAGGLVGYLALLAGLAVGDLGRSAG